MKRNSALPSCCVLVLACLWVGAAHAFPVDDYARTGIRRLKFQQDALNGLHRGPRLVPGARWPVANIKLRMRDQGRDFELTTATPKDPVLQPALEKVLKQWSWRKYDVVVLDITDPAHPRYAAVNEQAAQTPGSVAKVLVASGMFEQLKQRFPTDIAAREKMLRETIVAADDWAMKDSHDLPVITGENLEKSTSRRVVIGDKFSLWEWMDGALSASNNSAAAMLWREATLMKLLGADYPPAKLNADLWKQLGRDALTNASFDVVSKPLLDAGLDPEIFRLRMYFTKGGGKYIRSQSSSATALSLVQWLLRVEQGRMVDEWSSLELKKMLYLTRRRVRYLHTHKLDNFAAFFKSGSLFKFKPETTERVQYEGDEQNVLNSLIEIDTTPPPAEALAAVTGPAADLAAKTPHTNPAGKPYVYLVAVMSNELKRNAAEDHARLAEAIHALITATKDAPAVIPTSPDAVKVPDVKEGADDKEDGADAAQ
jgi:hypothetical protein